MEESREMQGNISTVLLIQNDCESIKQLALNYHDSIFCMRIIPYMALFCRSFQEYADTELISPEVDEEIYDLRNSINFALKKNNFDIIYSYEETKWLIGKGT